MRKLNKAADKKRYISYFAFGVLEEVSDSIPWLLVITAFITNLLSWSLDKDFVTIDETLREVNQVCLINIAGISTILSLSQIFLKRIVLDKQSEKSYKTISYFEINVYIQFLFDYIRLCFSPKKWNKDTERITESMMQYVLTVKNPKSKEAFLKACLEMSEELSAYSLNCRSYACHPICKNLQSIPKEKLHSTFQEIHSILKERKENYETF